VVEAGDLHGASMREQHSDVVCILVRKESDRCGVLQAARGMSREKKFGIRSVVGLFCRENDAFLADDIACWGV